MDLREILLHPCNTINQWLSTRRPAPCLFSTHISSFNIFFLPQIRFIFSIIRIVKSSYFPRLSFDLLSYFYILLRF